MKPNYSLLVFVLFTLTTNIFAQSTTDRKVKKAGKEIEKTAEAVESIKAIFKKKNQDQSNNEEENADEQASNGSVDKPKTSNPNTIKEKEPPPSSNSSNKLKPGDIHPDAVVLDVDYFEPFNLGAAVIHKGSSTALINAKGNIIVPFNKYNLHTEKDFNSGLFEASFSDYRSGYSIIVDKNGEALENEINNGSVLKDGRFIRLQLGPIGNTKTYVNIEGEKIFSLTNVTKSMACYKDGLIPFEIDFNGSQKRLGYKNLKDQIVMPAQWDVQESECFSNGAAVVGKINEFGEKKFGFIDTSGKVIVPIMYSRKPESFSDGLAKVYSKEALKAKLSGYSYINKKGELVIENPIGTFSSFNNGYAFSDVRVMDKQGKIISAKDFLTQFGIPEEIIHSRFGVNWGYENTYDGKMLVSFRGSDGHMYKFYHVLLDLVNKKIIFLWRADAVINPFDPVARLAHVVEHGESTRSETKREGYINEEGIFMIVKGEVSKW